MLLEKLKRILSAEEPVATDDTGIREAVAALLIHASRIDDDVDPAEVAARDRLLREKFDVSVAEIAFRAGFLDAGYFARLFRKRFGITPREWRAGHAPQS